ncbi:MAG: hypothetical protein ACJAVR_004154 [Paracoccaceae bacterium]|jgi:hypothetical protein
MSSVQLDLAKLLGYKIFSEDERAAVVTQDAKRLGAKFGAKDGIKLGEKLGEKLGAKLGSKVGDKAAPATK